MIMSRRNITYDQVLAVARKYAAGFRDFNLPAAQRAITAELGFSPATWLSHLIRQAMDQLVTEGLLTAFNRGQELPGGGTSVYREYRTPATPADGADDGQPAADEYRGLALAWAGATLEYVQTDEAYPAFRAWLEANPDTTTLTRENLHGAELVVTAMGAYYLGGDDLLARVREAIRENKTGDRS
jgi:hypothetical protein